MCQWEDHVEPYLEATKSLYKDLVKARKNADTGQIEITTLAYQVRPLENPPSSSPRRMRVAHRGRVPFR